VRNAPFGLLAAQPCQLAPTLAFDASPVRIHRFLLTGLLVLPVAAVLDDRGLNIELSE
jgi:hypothetical protein